MTNRSWLAMFVSAPLAAAALGTGLLFALQTPDAQASDRREFTVGNDGATCPHGVTFQGKTTNLDGSTTWSYLIENKDGPGCGTSHWVLSLCQTAPSAYDAFVKGNPNGSLTGKSGDPTTGVVGIKWNDIADGFTDPPGAKFSVTLEQDFAIDKNVPIAIQVGVSTNGVIPGTIEGPACEKPATPTATDTATPTPTPTATATPTPTDTPRPIGGVGGLGDPSVGAGASAGPNSSTVSIGLVAAIAAMSALGGLGGAAWYTGRRRQS